MPPAACAVPGTSIETLGDTAKIARVSKMIKKKWLTIAVFFLIAGFFGYLIYTNVSAIMSLYKTYRANSTDASQVAMVAASSSGVNPAEDDEAYNIVDAKDSKQDAIDNKVISENIGNIKSQYEEYNKLIKSQRPDSQDVVDEKIINADYDNY